MSDFLVVANCKQGGNAAYFSKFIDCLQEQAQSMTSVCQVVLLPQMPYLQMVVEKSSGVPIVGVQSVCPAYEYQVTGGVTASMVAEMGAKFVCIGHSERRMHCFENEKIIALQYQQAVLHGLTPILCIGETAKERQEGRTLAVLEEQLSGVFLHEGFDKLPKHDIVVAYEPVWAIGAKQAARVEDVEEAFLFLHRYFAKQMAFERQYFCYGGSVDQDNCQQFYAAQYVSGLLVGRCCLNVERFMEVVAQCSGS